MQKSFWSPPPRTISLVAALLFVFCKYVFVCFTDNVDVSILHFEPVGGIWTSGQVGYLRLVLQIDISGNYVLDPSPAASQQDYKVQLYISNDEHLDAVDKKVKKHSRFYKTKPFFRQNYPA